MGITQNEWGSNAVKAGEIVKKEATSGNGEKVESETYVKYIMAIRTSRKIVGERRQIWKKKIQKAV